MAPRATRVESEGREGESMVKERKEGVEVGLGGHSFSNRREEKKKASVLR